MFSVTKACEHAGLDPVVTSNSRELFDAAAVILPGVGAFGEAMANLQRLDLISPIQDVIASGKPFVGICLGMQLLFSESEEFGRTKGLGVVPGRVIRFPSTNAQGATVRVPQIGWNRISRPATISWDKTLLASTVPGEHMYFLHSYYAVPEESDVVLCTTDYEGLEYCSGVAVNNVVGLQFHPEKSAGRGVAIYETLARRISKAKNRTS